MYSSGITWWDAGGKCTYAREIDVSKTIFFQKAFPSMFSSSPAGSKSGPCSFSSRRAAWTDRRRRSSLEQRSKTRIRSTEILTTCTLARWSPESVLSQSSTQSACTHVHGHETWSWSRRAIWSQNREENLHSSCVSLEKPPDSQSG